MSNPLQLRVWLLGCTARARQGLFVQRLDSAMSHRLRCYAKLSMSLHDLGCALYPRQQMVTFQEHHKLGYDIKIVIGRKIAIIREK
jgi:hypothetical protein